MDGRESKLAKKLFIVKNNQSKIWNHEIKTGSIYGVVFEDYSGNKYINTDGEIVGEVEKVRKEIEILINNYSKK